MVWTYYCRLLDPDSAVQPCGLDQNVECFLGCLPAVTSIKGCTCTPMKFPVPKGFQTIFHARIKHLDIQQHHYIRDEVAAGRIELTYVPTESKGYPSPFGLPKLSATVCSNACLGDVLIMSEVSHVAPSAHSLGREPSQSSFLLLRNHHPTVTMWSDYLHPIRTCYS